MSAPPEVVEILRQWVRKAEARRLLPVEALD